MNIKYRGLTGMLEKARCRRLFVLPLLMIWVAAGVAHGATATGKPRAAVWSSSSTLQNAAALAESMLSDRGIVQLVERQELQKALDEQVLSSSSLVDANSAVKLGQIVSSDLLVVLEGDLSNAGIVVFDAHSGLRLWDDAAGGITSETIAADLVSAVQAAVAKQGQTANGSHVLCIQTVRNADLPHDMDSFCRATGRLLERQLIACPDVSVLERARLDRLIEERQLTGANAALTVSPVLISLQISRTEAGSGKSNQGLTVTAVMNDVGGNQLATVSASIAQPRASDLVDALFPKMLQALRVAAPARVTDADRAAESRRFLYEVSLRWSHNEATQALEAAEAAYALNPGDHHTQAMYAHAQIVRAASLICTGMYADPSQGTELQIKVIGRYDTRNHIYSEDDCNLSLQLALRSLQTLEEAGVRISPNWPQSAAPRFAQEMILDTDPIVRHTCLILRFYLVQLAHEQFQRDPVGSGIDKLVLTPTQKELFASVLREFRHYRVEIEEPLALAQVSDLSTFRRYGIFLTDLLRDTRVVCAISGEQWTTDWSTLADHWTGVASQFAVTAGTPIDIPAGFTEMVQSGSVHDVGGGYVPLDWRMTEADWHRFESLYATIGKLPGARARQIAKFAHDKVQLALVERNMPPQIMPPPLAKIMPRMLAGAPVNENPMVGPGTPWADSLLLMDAKDPQNEIAEVGFPCVEADSNSVYAISLDGQDPRAAATISLWQFNLQNGQRKRISSLAMGALREYSPRLMWIASHNGGQAILCSGYYVLCVPQAGIYLFPLDGGTPRRIDRTTATLPASTYHSAAVLDDTLYLGDGSIGRDGYFLAYNLKTGDLKTLASSRRVIADGGSHSPFDNIAPLFVYSIQPDPARHRLILLIGNASWEKGKSGWWSFDPPTGQFRQVYACQVPAASMVSEVGVWASRIGDRITFGTQLNPPAALDLATDKVSPLQYIPSVSNTMPGNRQFNSGPALQGTLAMVDDWVWGRFGRYPNPTGPQAGQGMSLQCFDPPTNDTIRVGDWPDFFEPVSADRVIAGDGQNLWRLDVPTNDPAAMAKLLVPPRPVGATIEKIPGPPVGGNLPWSSVRTIYDVARADNDAIHMLCPILRDGYVYVLACGDFRNDSQNIQLRRYSLADGSRTDLGTGTTTISLRNVANRAEQVSLSFNVTSAIDARNYYFAEMDRHTIEVFPLDGGRPSMVTIPPQIGPRFEGFSPMADGKLVICVETPPDSPLGVVKVTPVRSVLLSLDPATGHAHTLSFATAAPSQSAPDGLSTPMRLRFFHYDEPHHRAVFFGISPTPDSAADGLYACAVEGNPKVLFGLDFNNQIGVSNSAMDWDLMMSNTTGRQRGNQWIFGFAFQSFEMNLENGSVRSLIPPAPPGQQRVLYSPMERAGDWVFQARFGRVKLDGSQFEQFPDLRPILHNQYGFMAHLLQATPDGRNLVVADNGGLWMLQLKVPILNP